MFVITKNGLSLPRKLSDGVMVALQILILPVQVRALVGQQGIDERVKGAIVPSFFEMIKKKYIAKLANDCLLDTDRFIVGIVISTDNAIKVFLDGDNGVTIKNCVEVSRFIENSLDRDNEDFELSVSSAGVDHPFVLLRQYINNINNNVSVIKTDGVKIKGILKKADDDTVEILEEVKHKNKKNKSTTYGEVITIPMEEIKETKRVITF